MATANSGSNRGIENLKPFKPGQSGNPNGRPVTPAHVKEAFRAHTMEAKDTLLEIMRDKEAKSGDRVRAADIILNRAWGTPEQSVAVSGSMAAIDVDTSKLDKTTQDALLNAVVGIFGDNTAIAGNTTDDETETSD